MMTEERKRKFFENLAIADEDKPRAEKFLTSKGVEKHILLKEKLFNWIEGDKIEYSMIASAYRYDKRIGEPWYNFIETYDEDGNPIWRCECHIVNKEYYLWRNSSSKKHGKKAVAYDMLCDILDWEN